MFRGVNGAFANDDIGRTVKDGADQFFNIIAAVLVIGIGVDDDVSAIPQTGVKACHKALGEAFVAAEVYDVMDAPASGDLYGIIFAAVIDDEIFNSINTVNVFWEGIKSDL
jgi:hypothetical protein